MLLHLLLSCSRCENCGVCDIRTVHKPEGKSGFFVIFSNVTQCRSCDHEWVHPLHYIWRVSITDAMKVSVLPAAPARALLFSHPCCRVHPPA